MPIQQKQMYKLRRPDGSQSTYHITPTKLQEYLKKPGYSMVGGKAKLKIKPTITPTQPTASTPQQPQLTLVNGVPGSSDEYDQWIKQGRVFQGGKWYEPSGTTTPTTQPQQPVPQAPATPTGQVGEIGTWIDVNTGQGYSGPKKNAGDTPASSTTGQPQQPQTGAYIIQQGDTLSAIAQRHGTTVQALMAANPQIKNPNLIYAGASLNIPQAGQVPISPEIPQAPITPQQPPVVPPGAPGVPGTPGVPVVPQQPGVPGTPGIPDTPGIPGVPAPDDDQQYAGLPPEAVAMIKAGADWKNVLEYMKSLEEPEETEEERKTRIYEEYGITDLEEEAFATPEETFESIYKRVYEDANLADVKIKIDKVQAELDAATESYNLAVGDINENAFLSEAGRTGRIRKTYNMYEAKARRLQGKITILSNEYERGQDRAENVAIRVLSEIEQGQQRTKDELSYYRTRAQADLEAELETAEEEEAKELMRYFPEYLKTLPEPEKKAPTTKIVDGRLYSWNSKTGKWEDTGIAKEEKAELLSPTEAATLGVPYGTTKAEAVAMGISPERWKETAGTKADEKKQAIKDMSSQLSMVAGSDGYVSPEDYKKAKKAWIAEGLTSKDFDETFEVFINPTHPENYISNY